MKLLDKYVAKNFLIGYIIAFCVLMGLRIIIDLFVNLDEFTEHANLGFFAVVGNVLSFYALHSLLYFRDFAGMITVVAAAFSLGKMIRFNELVAVMASGVSLKRVIMPIVILSFLLTGLLVIDQELLIPPLSDKLVRGQDALPGREKYDVWFIDDDNGSLICTEEFYVKTSTMNRPTIILRSKKADSAVWEVTGRISADKAVYNPQTEKWDFINGLIIEKGSEIGAKPIASYASSITPKDIPVMRRSRHITLLSSHQLSLLAAQRTKVKDLAQLYSQKHFRITDPIISLVMLMISLPILVCRDPKAMKSAIMISFATTSACFVTVFICKMLAVEAIFDRVIPEFWAWLPVFIFAPVAILELDSMKT
ncbi:MAG: LptF/LptG family permease [Phycisphaerae bacterium]|nr:LptF/LptG family permease [Phycisphaerae bacterium]MDD5380683.1 LptF/LptG family permease [Phycisphaerae bacterium]